MAEELQQFVAVDAMVAHLSRAVDVLEAEGIRFSDGGVHLQRPPLAGTIIHSERSRSMNVGLRDQLSANVLVAFDAVLQPTASLLLRLR